MSRADFVSFSTVVFIFGFIFLMKHYRAYDDTDIISTGERSGLSLYTDNLTGCQYLKAGLFGGITPRMDGHGNQVGCE